MRHITRPAPLIATILLAAATVTGLSATSASAAVASLTCTGTSPITYTPGLRFTPRTITYVETDTYTSCLDSADPTLTAGSSINSDTGPFRCLSALTTDAGGYTVNWNNGQSTTFYLTFTDTIAAGIETVTGTGTATSGELTGATAEFVWAYTLPNPLACLTPAGATSQNGTIIATALST
jgi:hypothetical protein